MTKLTKQIFMISLLGVFQMACDPSALIQGTAQPMQSETQQALPNDVDADESDVLPEQNYDSFDGPVSLPVTPPKNDEECLPGEQGDLRMISYASEDPEFKEIDFPDDDDKEDRPGFAMTMKHIQALGAVFEDGLEGEIEVCEYKPELEERRWTLIDPENYPDLKLEFEFENDEEAGSDDFIIDSKGRFKIPADWFSPKDSKIGLKLKDLNGTKLNFQFKKSKGTFFKK